LWRTGLPLHQAWAAAAACHPASSSACQDLVLNFNGSATDKFMASKGAGGVLLQLLPALIGAFAGAPVLARELETGTFRFAWTQGFGRWRWALAKLVALAVVLAAATAALGVLVSWYYQPYLGTGSQPVDLVQNSPFADLFPLRAVTFPAWTLAAFAISALAGMLIRRVVPAIVTALAVYAGIAFATAGLLREHYMAPLVTSSPNLPGTAWIISQWSTLHGRFAFAGNPPVSIFNQLGSCLNAGNSKPLAGGFPEQQALCLAQHGYTQWTSYQPASRLWPFQWIEGGWLLALSALLIAAIIVLVHRRAA
jgi:ABC-type transport system involved in multi-copper enzyme maturation permease subunit